MGVGNTDLGLGGYFVMNTVLFHLTAISWLLNHEALTELD